MSDRVLPFNKIKPCPSRSSHGSLTRLLFDTPGLFLTFDTSNSFTTSGKEAFKASAPVSKAIVNKSSGCRLIKKSPSIMLGPKPWSLSGIRKRVFLRG